MGSIERERQRNIAAGFNRGSGRGAGLVGGVGGLAAFFGALWGFIVLLWWLLKVVAFIIFIVAIVAILGALLNGNDPATHDIIWAIVTFIAVWVL